MTRKLMWPVLVIGLAMVVLPFAISLPGRASAGQRMINDFHPIMQPASVKTTVNYYYKTFVPLRAVANGGVAAAGEEQQMVLALASAMHMTPAHLETYLAAKFPAMAKLLASFPALVPIFKNVPGGLNHYLPLVTTMNGNVGNYAKIDALPNFNLFTWFFVVPGALLLLISLWGLGAWSWVTAPTHRHPHRPVAAH
jgi:hypothetical protein